MLELVLKNRSYRRFAQGRSIDRKALEGLVNLARLSASAANKQPLKYILSCEPQKNALIFETLAWAAYLKDWKGPAEGERPAAYIIVLNDTEIGSAYCHVDLGIACQSMLLGAVDMGLGGCILASVNRDRLRKELGIPERCEILAVVALGKPVEKVVVEKAQGDIKYWRDQAGVHHVPKRSIEEIIIDL